MRCCCCCCCWLRCISGWFTAKYSSTGVGQTKNCFPRRGFRALIPKAAIVLTYRRAGIAYLYIFFVIMHTAPALQQWICGNRRDHPHTSTVSHRTIPSKFSSPLFAPHRPHVVHRCGRLCVRLTGELRRSAGLHGRSANSFCLGRGR